MIGGVGLADAPGTGANEDGSARVRDPRAGDTIVEAVSARAVSVVAGSA